MSTKRNKKENLNLDFSNSIEKIKSTTRTVNNEVLDTAVEVLEDLRTNGTKLGELATTRVQEAIKDINVKNGVKLIKNTAKNINEYSLETADELIDFTVEGGKNWQAFLSKALKEGTALLGKQQDLTLSILEGLKGQVINGTKRTRQLLNIDFNWRQVEKEVKEVTAQSTKSVRKTVKKASKKVAKATKTAEATIEKTIDTITANIPSEKDNLKVIEGVGPKIEKLLNEAGIYTFGQLEKADTTRLQEVLKTAGPRFKMHNPTTWTQQAALAASGDMEALKTLQNQLKGGKVVK